MSTNLLIRRARKASWRQYLDQPEAITGFDQPEFRDSEQRAQDAAENAADWRFEDGRDREHFGEGA